MWRVVAQSCAQVCGTSIALMKKKNVLCDKPRNVRFMLQFQSSLYYVADCYFSDNMITVKDHIQGKAKNATNIRIEGNQITAYNVINIII